MENIILIGGGGHCISCIDVIRMEDKYKILGILDIKDKVGSKVLDFEIIGTDEDISYLAEKKLNFLITLGQIKSSSKRRSIFSKVYKAGGKMPVIISPLAYVSRDAQIQEGTIIMHNALVNAGTSIGKVCIVNTGALLEHEVVVGDFCHISTHAVVNGQVNIGNDVFIGSNSVIWNNIIINDGAIVAAGSIVSKTIDRHGIYSGE